MVTTNPLARNSGERMKPLTSRCVVASITAWLLCSITLSAEVWRVGPTQEYKVPSAVAGLVKDGDEVWIDPVEYVGDVAVWRAHRLKLFRTPSAQDGSFAVLRAGGRAAESKAIWVIKGDDCIVSGIDFRDCQVPDRNGAGIRVEGTNILVTRCAFRQNQDGILAGNNMQSTITVEYCEFDRSGAGDGLSHAIYINHVKAFFFRYNYSHGTLVGHECKSRAHFNYIGYNRLSNEDGTGSRNLDLPNGGTSIIIGNIFHKGANAENGNVIGYGLEGMSDTVDNSLYIAYNTVVSSRGLATFLRIDTTTTRLRVVNNMIVGNVTFLIGAAKSADTLQNLRLTSATAAGFVDPSSYDYRITASSPARGMAVDPGVATSIIPNYAEMPLTAVLEYVHPCQERIRLASRDMGAYEFSSMTSVHEEPSATMMIYPTPAADVIYLAASIWSPETPTRIMNAQGELLQQSMDRVINIAALPAGMYIIVHGMHRGRVIVQR